jgi:alpha-1,2-mannosyltransferase
MSRVPDRRTALVATLFLVFAAVNAGNALHKGGDFGVFLEAGERFLAGAPLYEGSSPGSGVIGPPFHALVFAPVAALAHTSVPASRLLWYAINLAALVLGVRWWAAALLPPGSHRALWRQPAVVWALVAIVLPAQTNFEHQNMNALLLAVTGGAAAALARRDAAGAGALLGAAAALKAFPALLVLYLAMRRQWRTSAIAATTAAALTLVASVRYGTAALWRVPAEWIAINGDGGWPLREQNQSLFAMLARVSAPHAAALTGAASACAIVLLGMLAWRQVRAARAHLREGTGLAGEIAIVLVAAVLLSPIAWDHYFVLCLPAILVLASSDAPASRHAVPIIAVLLSGPSPVLVGARGYDLARAWSSSTIAGLLCLSVGLRGLMRRRTGESSKAGS